MKFDSKSMREGPILKSVIVYTVPIILTGLLQLLFNAADLIVVGWFSGSDSVAAVGATGALTNLIINLFIGLSVGAGVALATSISQAVSAILVLLALMKRQDACRFEFEKMHIYKNALLRMVKIGVPAGLQGSLFSISNVLIQSSVNSFGAAHMSGSAAASSIEGFCYVTMNSFHQTSLNFCGQNYGAGDFKRVKRITWVCLMTVAVAGFVVGNLSYIFGRELLKIYITDSPEAINYGMERLKFMVVPYFLCGIMDTTTGSMRGIGSSVIPMIITVVGVCVMRIVWIYTVFALPQYHTFSGLFISYPISWLLTFAALFISFTVVMRRKEKKANNFIGAVQ